MKYILDLVRSSSSLNYGPYGENLNSHQKYLIRKLYGQRLTYLTPIKLAKIAYFIGHLASNSVKGACVEFGAALGGCSAFIAALKMASCQLHVYDVFARIPPPTKEDTEKEHNRYEVIKRGESLGIGRDLYYGYTENLMSLVDKNISAFMGSSLAKNNIFLHKVDITKLSSLGLDSISFAHIDVDWYEPTSVALELVGEKLPPGGIIVVDDYFTWNGAKKAVDDYLCGKGSGLYKLVKDCNSVALIREPSW
jgi:hypothetical protein